MSNDVLHNLIAQSKGADAAERYSSYSLDELSVLHQIAHEILTNIPPSSGACAPLSAGWAAMLEDHHSIPAVVVAGDLQIGDIPVFKCEENLPDASKSSILGIEEWDSHCWIEYRRDHW